MAQGSGAALLIENIRVDASRVPLPHGLGDLQLSVSAPDRRSLFLGSASSDNIDTYLTGAPYDVVVELTSGGKVKTRPVPGTQSPPPPTSQHFWSQQSSGVNPAISALIGSDKTVVVMNSDASSGVTADLVVSLTLPGAHRAGAVAIGVGAILVLLGAVALWRSSVARKRAQVTGAHAAGVASAGAVAAGVASAGAVAAGAEPPVTPDPEPVAAVEEIPVEEVVETAVEPTAEIPVEEVAETPVEPAAEIPVDEVVETPLEQVEAPVEAVVESPVQVIGETPAEPIAELPQPNPVDPALIPPWVHVEDTIAIKPVNGPDSSSDSV
jgi:hypothetical protein